MRKETIRQGAQRLRVPINDLKRHFHATRHVVTPAIQRTLESGRYVLGKEGETFEEAFASYCGAAECVGVANGTDALELALRAIGVQAGSRVATVANAGFYSSTALRAIGARPVYVDVSWANHLMDAESLRKVAGEGLDAVIVTHLYGQIHDIGALRRITDPRSLPIIEDCAQAHGATHGGKRAGSFGDAAAFSFYPTKNLGAIGDGGAVVTSDPAIAAKIRLLRQYGWNPKYNVTVGGARNSRLDEIQAAVLSAKLPYLDGWNVRRREIAARYSRGLQNPRVRAPRIGDDYVGHLYVIVCDEDRAGLRTYLSKREVSTEINFPVPDHLQLGITRDHATSALPITERLSECVLTLPCFPELLDEEVDFVVARVNEWQ